jgi:hypothetical protein
MANDDHIREVMELPGEPTVKAHSPATMVTGKMGIALKGMTLMVTLPISC